MRNLILVLAEDEILTAFATRNFNEQTGMRLSVEAKCFSGIGLCSHAPQARRPAAERDHQAQCARRTLISFEQVSDHPVAPLG